MKRLNFMDQYLSLYIKITLRNCHQDTSQIFRRQIAKYLANTCHCIGVHIYHSTIDSNELQCFEFIREEELGNKMSLQYYGCSD